MTEEQRRDINEFCGGLHYAIPLFLGSPANIGTWDHTGEFPERAPSHVNQSPPAPSSVVAAANLREFDRMIRRIRSLGDSIDPLFSGNEALRQVRILLDMLCEDLAQWYVPVESYVYDGRHEEAIMCAEEKIMELASEYSLPLKRLAAEFGLDVSGAAKTQVPRNRGARHRRTDDLRRRAWELHRKGRPNVDIADELQVSESSVSRYLKGPEPDA